MLELDGVQQTTTAYGNEQRITGGHNAIAQLFAASFGVGHQILVFNHAKSGESRSRTQRIAGKGGAVGTRSEQSRKFLAESDHAAHRESACHALGESHHIRRHAAGQIVTLECEPLAGTSDTGLYFIDDEQRVVDIAQFAHELDVIGAQRLHAGFALDKFQNHSSHRTLAIATETGLCKSVVQGDLVAGAHEFDVRHQRIIRLADTGFPRGGQRTHRTAMEA